MLEKAFNGLGFLVQPIRIRDNLELQPDAYNIVISGVVRGRGKWVGQELAINPGDVHGEPNGTQQGTHLVSMLIGLTVLRETMHVPGYTVVSLQQQSPHI